MIQFQKINEKGDRLKAYTHKNYLSKQYNSQIQKVQKRNRTICGVIGYGSTIITYYALNNVANLKYLVDTKLFWKGKFLIASAIVGLTTSLVASVFCSKSVRSKHQTMLKNQVFPAWFNKDRVINPDRVFFQIDDNKQYQPSIWHSSITPSVIQSLIPDFIVGNPNKPLFPVAQVHH